MSEKRRFMGIAAFLCYDTLFLETLEVFAERIYFECVMYSREILVLSGVEE